MPRVSIIIVNWNGREHLADCLDSLKQQTFTDFEVVLVDNGSSDGSVDFLKSTYFWVKLVELSNNTGFATGNNIGLTHASGEYIVTLNNDTKADERWLETIVAVADEYSDVGMVGSRICSFDEPDVIDSLGHGICKDGMSRGRFRLQRYSELSMNPVEEILLPSACVALYRRAMLEETGFFDDDFFAYAEDTDLGLRCRLAGWGALLATNAIVYHKYSKTGGVFSPFKIYLVERNHYWVALKNFPCSLLLLVPLYTTVRFGVQLFSLCAAKGSGSEFIISSSKTALVAAVGRGLWDSVKGIPVMLCKRKRIMEKRKISVKQLKQLLAMYQMRFTELLDINVS